MKIKIEQREKVIIGILILVVAAIGVYRLLFIPRVRKISNVRKETEILSVKMKDARNLKREMPFLEKEIISKRKEFFLFQKGLVKKTEISDAISKLSQAGEKYDLKFLSVKPRDVKGEKIVSISREISCRKLFIAMEVRGRYNNLGRYFEELEKLPFTIRVEHFEIHGKEDILPDVDAIVSLALYVYLPQ
jgi:Tfp pilus assembly protein PilO